MHMRTSGARSMTLFSLFFSFFLITKKACVNQKHRKNNVVKTSVTCIVTYTAAGTMHLLSSPAMPTPEPQATAGLTNMDF